MIFSFVSWVYNSELWIDAAKTRKKCQNQILYGGSLETVQPDGGTLWYFKLKLLDLTEL